MPYPLAPTPGYEIMLQSKGIIEPGRKVTIFLHHDEPAGTEACGTVYPVERLAPVTSEPSGIVALLALFADPTEAARAQGYGSPFSEAKAGMATGISVKGHTAYVDVPDGQFVQWLCDFRNLLLALNCGILVQGVSFLRLFAVVRV